MSLFKIKNFLYLSNKQFASCLQCLHENEITSVITVDAEPLSWQQQCSLHVQVENAPVICHYFYALDLIGFNMVKYFAQSNEIIEESVEKHKNVLVHCLMGQSRSVAIVLSYIMKLEQLNVQQAMKQVKQLKSDIMPNAGFIWQLHLFELMNYSINESSIYYLIVEKRARFSTSTQQMHDFENAWLHLPEIKLHKKVNATVKCKKCRFMIVRSSQIVSGESPQCSFVYLLNLSQRISTDALQNINDSGKICCENCSAKLGSFDWEGKLCCGERLTPAFQLSKRRVDIFY